MPLKGETSKRNENHFSISYCFPNSDKVIPDFGQLQKIGLKRFILAFLEIIQLVLKENNLICIVSPEHVDQLIIHLFRCAQLKDVSNQTFMDGILDN